MKIQSSASLVLCLGVALVTACQSIQSKTASDLSQSDDPSWQGSMQALRGHLETLAPSIFNSKEFEAPENRQKLTAEINQMAQVSKNLNHNPTLTHRDPTVRFVASQFAHSLARARSAMNAGQVSYARYELMKVTSSCVQCHSRMQQGPEFKSFLFQEPFLKSLPAQDQAEYLISMRKFDRASEVLQKSLRSNVPDHGNYEKLTFLALQLSVQYEQSPQQALQVIRSVEKNPSISPYLKEKVALWKKAAELWKKQSGSALTMAEAQKALLTSSNELEVMRAIPTGLMRLSEDVSGNEVGELLFMMGRAYEFLSEGQAFELHEHYYESCVRSVPHSAVARKCFNSLKASIQAGYSGTSGLHLPVEVQIWLADLEKLAD